MKLNPFIIILGACFSICYSTIYSKVKDNVISLLQRSIGSYNEGATKVENLKRMQDNVDIKRAREKAHVIKRAKDSPKKSNGPVRNQVFGEKASKERYHIDPVLNFWARRSGDTGESSSSIEMRDWKDEWKEQWLQKKFEAINSTWHDGDTVNMVAARPWGVPCGDPNQHDMPWGSCMLPMECESEYRIYRGDYFCGRTQFVCCAIQVSTYDMYQGFDVSFGESDIATSSEEIRNRDIGSKERHKKRKKQDKDRRERNRNKRKRAIKRNIKNIIKEIRRILSRSYRNGTTARKRKTRQLKKFVKNLKKQYKKDRLAVQSIHEVELIKIDNLLQRKLDQMKGMNQNFISNKTFRDIVVNGTVNPKVVRMLIETYPDLAGMLDRTRRSGSLPEHKNPDYLEYDIEYGMLYY